MDMSEYKYTNVSEAYKATIIDKIPFVPFTLPPPVKWHWKFLGDSGLIMHITYDVSWWKRFWTRIFFGSVWEKQNEHTR